MTGKGARVRNLRDQGIVLHAETHNGTTENECGCLRYGAGYY